MCLPIYKWIGSNLLWVEKNTKKSLCVLDSSTPKIHLQRKKNETKQWTKTSETCIRFGTFNQENQYVPNIYCTCSK